mmetsp:Transcript_43390/g.49914  ORF Transcript_43390/g.49914 Transcript_43390/m.49914 type:complete len:168 (+) Transcript_43390:637-1140(+)
MVFRGTTLILVMALMMILGCEMVECRNLSRECGDKLVECFEELALREYQDWNLYYGCVGSVYREDFGAGCLPCDFQSDLRKAVRTQTDVNCAVECYRGYLEECDDTIVRTCPEFCSKDETQYWYTPIWTPLILISTFCVIFYGSIAILQKKTANSPEFYEKLDAERY